MVDEANRDQPILEPAAIEPPAIAVSVPPDAAGAQEIHHPDGRIEHPRVRYEHSDISFRGVLAVIAVAACFLPLMLYLAMLFFRHDERAQQAAKRSAFPLAASQPAGLPTEPRLEQLDRLAGVASRDALRRRAADKAKLHGYGETTEAGFVHVPIDWAMTQAVQRLPSKPTKSGPSGE
jgi:hypothetical protein